MDIREQSHYFLLFALIASLVVVFFIIQPFLVPLILAAVFAFLFQSLYRRILRSTKRASLAAFITTILSIIIVLLPIAVIGTLIFRESVDLYYVLAGGGRNQLMTLVENVVRQFMALVPSATGFELDISQYARQGAAILARHLGSIFSSAAKMLLSAFVFLIAFYFLLKDGPNLKSYIVDLSPLNDADDEMISTRLATAVSSTVRGNLLIGLIQGALTTLGLLIFGVPNAILWGSLAAVLSLVPGLGTALVIAPAVVFLFLTGNIVGAIGLAVWGATAVGLVDNLLGPRLLGAGLKLHPLGVFLAVLGGLSLFGPLGFLLGPLAVSLCLALIDIHFSLRNRA